MVRLVVPVFAADGWRHLRQIPSRSFLFRQSLLAAGRLRVGGLWYGGLYRLRTSRRPVPFNQPIELLLARDNVFTWKPFPAIPRACEVSPGRVDLKPQRLGARGILLAEIDLVPFRDCTTAPDFQTASGR